MDEIDINVTFSLRLLGSHPDFHWIPNAVDNPCHEQDRIFEIANAIFDMLGLDTSFLLQLKFEKVHAKINKIVSIEYRTIPDWKSFRWILHLNIFLVNFRHQFDVLFGIRHNLIGFVHQIPCLYVISCLWLTWWWHTERPTNL